jgi:hypothetical protein
VSYWDTSALVKLFLLVATDKRMRDAGKLLGFSLFPV